MGSSWRFFSWRGHFGYLVDSWSLFFFKSLFRRKSLLNYILNLLFLRRRRWSSSSLKRKTIRTCSCTPCSRCFLLQISSPWKFLNSLFNELILDWGLLKTNSYVLMMTKNFWSKWWMLMLMSCHINASLLPERRCRLIKKGIERVKNVKILS